MALGRLGPEAVSAAEALAACVESEDTVLRLHAGLALSRIGPEAVPHVLPLLHSPNEDTVRASATILGRIGESATGALDELQCAAAQSPSPFVRIACWQAISAISGDPGPGLLELIPVLEAEDSGARQACLDAIRESGTAEESIREKVQERFRDPVGVVRGAAALTLARVEPDAKQALPHLLGLLSDDDLDVRAHAAMALAHYGPEASEALEPLGALMSVDAPSLQAVVQAALARIRGEASARD
jgi:HEAT repeat protein